MATTTDSWITSFETALGSLIGSRPQGEQFGMEFELGLWSCSLRLLELCFPGWKIWWFCF